MTTPRPIQPDERFFVSATGLGLSDTAGAALATTEVGGGADETGRPDGSRTEGRRAARAAQDPRR